MQEYNLQKLWGEKVNSRYSIYTNRQTLKNLLEKNNFFRMSGFDQRNIIVMHQSSLVVLIIKYFGGKPPSHLIYMRWCWMINEWPRDANEVIMRDFNVPWNISDIWNGSFAIKLVTLCTRSLMVICTWASNVAMSCVTRYQL